MTKPWPPPKHRRLTLAEMAVVGDVDGVVEELARQDEIRREQEEADEVSPEYGEFFKEWTELNKQDYWNKVAELRAEIAEREG